METILPIEQRVTVYSVYNNEIINATHSEKLKDKIKTPDVNAITEERKKCIKAMSNNNNLFSFVYVHENAKIDSEMNVTKPKLAFHKDYEKDFSK